jgi:hypothetical protein
MVRINYKDEKRLVYHRNDKNLGPALYVRNAFSSLARGKYNIIQSDDDYFIDSRYVSKAVKLLEERNDISFVFGGVYFNWKIADKIYRVDYNMPAIIDGMDLFINYKNKKYPYMPNICSLIFRRENALKMNIEEYNPDVLAGDLFVQLRLLLTGNAGFINDMAIVYTLHNSSLTLNVNHIAANHIDNNNKIINTTLADIGELGNIALLARELNKLNTEEAEKWLSYQTWRYLYWRIIETSQNAGECKVIMKLIKDKFSYLYDSLKEYALKRFGSVALL